MSRFLQLGWTCRRLVLGLLKLRTRGVKIILLNSRSEVLLIRNGYGDRSSFVLPGGGVGRREEPSAAAARELREEVGIAVADLRLLGDYHSTAEGKKDLISLYQGMSDESARPDRKEVVEASFYPPHALPEGTSPATRRRIVEWLAGSSPGGAW